MAEPTRPTSGAGSPAPDPSDAYERAHPEREAGMGRLDNNESTPTQRPDQLHEADKNRKDPRQINAHETTSEARLKANPNQPDHSMLDEEPLDDGPTEIVDKRYRRHPRTEGKGGTP